MALSMLHNVIGAKRKGGQQWTKIYEQVMKRHLELCVDLKDHRTAKDGLHQYRNLCQAVSSICIGSIILIVCCFLMILCFRIQNHHHMFGRCLFLHYQIVITG